MILTAILSALVGLAIGLGYSVWRVSALRSEHFAAALDAEKREGSLREEVATLRADLVSEDERLAAFRSVSQEALAAQSASLVQVAEVKYGSLQKTTDAVLSGHAKTISQSLADIAERIETLEKERMVHAGELRGMVVALKQEHEATRKETTSLTMALRDNRVRGTWGETQLRRVLERSGLSRHVDFLEQHSVNDGLSSGRPDVVIPLPGGRAVVIDSKVPLDKFLEAANEQDPALERSHQQAHAKAVASHVNALAGRDYTGKVDGAIDMVLMFLPGDAFLAAALDADPSLFEKAVAKQIYLVTPASLLPVLGAIAAAWQQAKIEESAQEIQALGSELYDRIAIFADHYSKVGSQLNSAVGAFNRSVASLDTRLLTTARRLSEHGASTAKELPQIAEIDERARQIRAVEPQPNVLPLSSDTNELGDSHSASF